MNRFLTASRLLADLPLTKVDGRQTEFTVRATSCARHLGCRTDHPELGSSSHWTLRWREMDSNYRYAAQKAVDFRSIPGIAEVSAGSCTT